MRHVMTRRWIVAVALFTAGAIMLSAPPGLYDSGTYAVAKAVAPREWWGAGFLVVAVIAAIPAVPRWVSAAALSGHLTAWSLCLGLAVVTGDAQSGTAWVWPALVAALVVHSTTEAKVP